MKNFLSITIDLDELEKNSPLEEEELIYINEYNELKEKILRKTKKNVGLITYSDVESMAYQPCYFINGERGSGKSTLLRTLRNALCNSEDLKIRSLADVDPTVLAESEMFFVHVLGHIKRMLGTASTEIAENKNLMKEACDCIRKMSRGVGMLARRPEKMNTQEDADYFIQESIRECISGSELKKSFAELVNLLCKIRKIDALLITVDDADMNFCKCRDVFETVRKYLLTPRMVYVFAGDLKLYTEVVRGMQMNHFERLSLEYDENRKSHIYALVDNLEDQYIMKLFPAENRINLSNFGGVLSKTENLICVKKSPKTKINVIDYLTIEICDYLGGFDKSNALNFISSFSVRSALQLINYWTNYISDKNDREINMKHWCAGIRLVVSHALIKYGVDDNDLLDSSTRLLMKNILQHVNNLNIGIDGFRMLPGMGDESLQKVSFYLSSELNRKITSTHNFISYIINIFPYLKKYGVDGTCDLELIKRLNYVDVRSGGAYCTKLISSFRKKGNKDIAPFSDGIIPLMSNTHVGNSPLVKRISVNEYLLSLSEFVEDNPDVENIMYFLAIYHSFSTHTEDDSIVCVLSLYNLLSLIQQLMEIPFQSITNNEIRNILVGDDELFLTTIDESDNGEKVKKLKELKINVGRKLYLTLKKLSEISVFEDVIEKIKYWLLENYFTEYNVDSSAMFGCWNRYSARCSDITSSSRLKSVYWGELVCAGRLYNSYLNAFIDAIENSMLDNNGEYCRTISDFPLWNILINSEKMDSKLYRITNMVNIASIEISFEIDKFERFCKLRIKLLVTSTINSLKNYMMEIINNHFEVFATWWGEMILAAEMRFISMYNNTRSVEGSDENVETEEGTSDEVRDKKLKKILSRIKNREKLYKSQLWENMNNHAQIIYKDIEKVVHFDAGSLRSHIMEKVTAAETEEEAKEVLRRKVREYEMGVFKYKERLKMSMEIDINQTEVNLRKQIEEYIDKQIKRFISMS